MQVKYWSAVNVVSLSWFLPLQETLQEGGALTWEVLSSGAYDVLLGRSPLQCAARAGNLAALALLLDAGALDAIDACDGNGLTALQVSVLLQLSFVLQECLFVMNFVSSCHLLNIIHVPD